MTISRTFVISEKYYVSDINRRISVYIVSHYTNISIIELLENEEISMERLVSVIIPVYNKKDYLKRSVYSIINQDYSALEIIIIDDGSTDGSSNLCDHFGMIDNRIRVVHSENRGVSSARNTGINLAKGFYIAFFDADDEAESNWISKLVNNIEEKSAQLSICSVQKEDMEGNKISVHGFDDDKVYKLNQFHELLDKEFFSALWDKLYVASVIKENFLKFDEKTSIWEDLLFNLEYILKLNAFSKIVCSHEILYHYKYNPQGLSKKYNKWQYASGEIKKKIDAIEMLIGLHGSSMFYSKRCCEWCNVELNYIWNNDNLLISNKIKQISSLCKTYEYEIMLASNKFAKEESFIHRFVLRRRKTLLIVLYLFAQST